jgi:hypothetical protein
MNNSMTPVRVVRGMSQSLCIVLLLLTCGAVSAQYEGHRIRNIVLVSATGPIPDTTRHIGSRVTE